ncbi:MAG: purine/pyrimidine permease [Firmicutes bacterium]|nr:purine/pyrimidine permease [Bacillota bacterium]
MANATQRSTQSGEGMLYELDDRPPLSVTSFAALQWFIFAVVQLIVAPVAVGHALGLNQQGIADFVQRTFFFCGLFSLLQLVLGHRLPLFEGPAGMWWGVLALLGSTSAALGHSLPNLRMQLEWGLFLTGIAVTVIGAFHLLRRLLWLFSPAVTGTFLVLLPVQMALIFLPAMLGIAGTSTSIDSTTAFLSIGLVALVIGLSLFGPGPLKSFGTLIGLLVGWIVWSVFHASDTVVENAAHGWIRLPQVFPWGMPQPNLSATIACLLCGLLLFSNYVATMAALEETIQRRFDTSTYDRGVTVTGIADMAAGAFGLIGFIPFTAGVAIIGLSRIASRLPFFIGMAVTLVLGLFPGISAFFGRLPVSVADAVLFASFAQMMSSGFSLYRQLHWDLRQAFVVCLPLLFAIGLSGIPPKALEGLPVIAQYLLGTPLLFGVLLSLLMDHLFLPQRRRHSAPRAASLTEHR